MPKGVDLVDDELILHVEGTASTQRVVRHIGGKSWPGLSWICPFLFLALELIFNFRCFGFLRSFIPKYAFLGRLTLTNHALYFEASGVITYEDAIKIDLSKDTEHTVKPAATGPFGPRFLTRLWCTSPLNCKLSSRSIDPGVVSRYCISRIRDVCY